MSSEHEIQVMQPINMPPPPIPPSYFRYVPEYRQEEPIIYTLPAAAQPVTTRYEYLVHISREFNCPVDSLNMALGPDLPIQIFYVACLMGDWYEMYHMIRDHGVNVNVPVSGKMTVLWFAAQKGYFDIVQNLLLFGADPNPISHKTGLSALDIAQNNRFGKTVNLLRAYGGKSAKKRL